MSFDSDEFLRRDGNLDAFSDDDVEEEHWAMTTTLDDIAHDANELLHRLEEDLPLTDEEMLGAISDLYQMSVYCAEAVLERETTNYGKCYEIEQAILNLLALVEQNIDDGVAPVRAQVYADVQDIYSLVLLHPAHDPTTVGNSSKDMPGHSKSDESTDIQAALSKRLNASVSNHPGSLTGGSATYANPYSTSEPFGGAAASGDAFYEVEASEYSDDYAAPISSGSTNPFGKPSLPSISSPPLGSDSPLGQIKDTRKDTPVASVNRASWGGGSGTPSRTPPVGGYTSIKASTRMGPVTSAYSGRPTTSAGARPTTSTGRAGGGGRFSTNPTPLTRGRTPSTSDSGGEGYGQAYAAYGDEESDGVHDDDDDDDDDLPSYMRRVKDVKGGGAQSMRASSAVAVGWELPSDPEDASDEVGDAFEEIERLERERERARVREEWERQDALDRAGQSEEEEEEGEDRVSLELARELENERKQDEYEREIERRAQEALARRQREREEVEARAREQIARIERETREREAKAVERRKKEEREREERERERKEREEREREEREEREREERERKEREEREREVREREREEREEREREEREERERKEREEREREEREREREEREERERKEQEEERESFEREERQRREREEREKHEEEERQRREREEREKHEEEERKRRADEARQEEERRQREDEEEEKRRAREEEERVRREEIERKRTEEEERIRREKERERQEEEEEGERLQEEQSMAREREREREERREEDERTRREHDELKSREAEEQRGEEERARQEREARERQRERRAEELGGQKRQEQQEQHERGVRERRGEEWEREAARRYPAPRSQGHSREEEHAQQAANGRGAGGLRRNSSTVAERWDSEHTANRAEQDDAQPEDGQHGTQRARERDTLALERKQQELERREREVEERERQWQERQMRERELEARQARQLGERVVEQPPRAAAAEERSTVQALPHTRAMDKDTREVPRKNDASSVRPSSFLDGPSSARNADVRGTGHGSGMEGRLSEVEGRSTERDPPRDVVVVVDPRADALERRVKELEERLRMFDGRDDPDDVSTMPPARPIGPAFPPASAHAPPHPYLPSGYREHEPPGLRDTAPRDYAARAPAHTPREPRHVQRELLRSELTRAYDGERALPLRGDPREGERGGGRGGGRGPPPGSSSSDRYDAFRGHDGEHGRDATRSSGPGDHRGAAGGGRSSGHGDFYGGVVAAGGARSFAQREAWGTAVPYAGVHPARSAPLPEADRLRMKEPPTNLPSPGEIGSNARWDARRVPPPEEYRPSSLSTYRDSLATLDVAAGPHSTSSDRLSAEQLGSGSPFDRPTYDAFEREPRVILHSARDTHVRGDAPRARDAHMSRSARADSRRSLPVRASSRGATAQGDSPLSALSNWAFRSISDGRGTGGGEAGSRSALSRSSHGPAPTTGRERLSASASHRPASTSAYGGAARQSKYSSAMQAALGMPSSTAQTLYGRQSSTSAGADPFRSSTSSHHRASSSSHREVLPARRDAALRSTWSESRTR